MKKLLLFALIILSCIYLDAQNSSQLNDYLLQNKVKNLSEAKVKADEWIKIPGNTQTKGWKQTLRAINFWATRVEDYKDIPSYCNEIEKFGENISTRASRGPVNWIPCGPDKRGTNATYMDGGIGRVYDIAFHPTNQDVMWAATYKGGIWKTTNAGVSWTPLTDNLTHLAFKSITIDPNNPNTLYAGIEDDEQGYFEYFLGNVQSWQTGMNYKYLVYKTTDGGLTWTKLSPLSNYAYIPTWPSGKNIIVNKNNSNDVALLSDTKLEVSNNAGSSWFNSIASNGYEFLFDMQSDPVNGNKLYCIMTDSAKTSLLLKTSTNFGNTWTTSTIISNSSNQLYYSRLAVSTKNPNYLYVVTSNWLNAKFSGIYQSTDGGITWNFKSNSPNIFDWYGGTTNGGNSRHCIVLKVDEKDENTIYAGSVNLWKSSDAGVTWEISSYWASPLKQSLHADLMNIKYNPLDKKYYVCNDGGISRTDSIKAGSWSSFMQNQTSYLFPTRWDNITDGLNISTIYFMDISDHNPDYIVAGTQDDATFFYSADSSKWLNIIGGDGLECALDEYSPKTVIGSNSAFNYYLSYNGGYTTSFFSTFISSGGHWGSSQENPLILRNPTPSKRTCYIGMEEIFKTNDDGLTWNPITNIKLKGVTENLFISPADSNDIAYSRQDSLFLSNDHGKTWRNTIPAKSSGLSYVYLSDILIKGNDTNKIYVTNKGYGQFAIGKKVIKSNDAGNTWTDITYNLPNLAVNNIIEWENDPYNTIFIGMDIGVFYTNDTLAQWLMLSGLPNVIVNDLEMDQTNEILYAGTYGRGVWKCDLKQLTSISENFTKEQIKIFPNPNNGEFKILFPESGNYSINIIDINGKLVSKENINQSNLYSINKKLMSGMYFVQILKSNGNLIGNYKVLIQ